LGIEKLLWAETGGDLVLVTSLVNSQSGPTGYYRGRYHLSQE
jgi:hypothetical protein